MHRRVWMILLAVCLLLCETAFADEPAEDLRFLVSMADGDTVELCAQETEGGLALLLPSFFDSSSMEIRGLEGGTLINKSKKSIPVEENRPTDLTALYSTIKPGVAYRLSLRDKDGKTVKLKLYRTENVPSLFLTLGKDADGETADRSWLNESKENRVLGGYALKVTADGQTETAEEIEWIKVRGNASFTHAHEKSYTLKLVSRQELVSGAGAAKKWVLIANDVDAKNGHDRTGIMNMSSRWLYGTLGGKYAFGTEAVDLYINGEYCGLYLLSEKAEIDRERIAVSEAKMAAEDTASVTRVVGSRGLLLNGKTLWEGTNSRDRMDTKCAQVTTVIYASEAEDAADPAISAGVRAYQYASGSVEKTPGGYLLETDFRFGDVPSWFITSRGAAIAVKNPEYASREQVCEIAAYVQGFEDALYAKSGLNAQRKHFTDYIDLDSWVSFCAVEFFLGNVDTFAASTFLSADRAEGVLQPIVLGPVWDNDLCRSNYTMDISLISELKLKSEESGFPFNPWIEQLFARSEYVSRMKALWDETMSSAVDRLAKEIIPSYRDRTAASQAMNAEVTQKLDPKGSVRSAYTAVRKRRNTWQKLWNSKRLKGLTLTQEGNKLVLAPDGNCTAVTWYRVNEADGSCEWLRSGESLTFAPKESGLYFAEAEGSNLLFSDGYGGGAQKEKNRAMLSPAVWFEGK